MLRFESSTSKTKIESRLISINTGVVGAFHPLLPLKSRFSSHMLDFTVFLNDSETVCSQSIFSNRFILSHICPCKIGKYVGKVSGFTNGLFLRVRYSAQFLFRIIEIHMGVGVQCYTDIRMTHNVL